MNQHKVQVFRDVVKMIKEPRVIQAQNLYSYRVVAQSSPFSGALAMQKVSRTRTGFSDAFKEYYDPYKFLQVLKGKDIPASEYYKYFVNITYEVFNQYGSPASGGERSEYNLLQELSACLSQERLGLTLFYHITVRTGFELSHPESNQ